MFMVKFKRAAAVTHGGKYETDFVNIPHIKAWRGHAQRDGFENASVS